MKLFDAQATLFDSAQVFHFEKTNDIYAANVSGRILTEKDTDAFACEYFDEKRDYEKILEEASAFDKVREAVSMFPGLRVVNQPAWEALIAFILSANNNVNRIKQLVRKLNEEYGEAVECGGKLLYGFPSPERLSRADESELREKTKCGYRAAYLIKTAKMISSGFPLDGLRDIPYEEARAELMKLPGVGGKVSDCVCLFGLKHAEAFPVDVWVKRLMEDWFHVEGTPEKVRKEAKSILGKNCGIIQQYLFHAARTGKIRILKSDDNK